MAALSGPLLVMLFCVAQAWRDVYFAGVFQGVDFFVVILLAFVLSTLIFGTLTAIRTPDAFAKLRAEAATVLAMNGHHRAGLDLLLLRAHASGACDRQHRA